MKISLTSMAYALAALVLLVLISSCGGGDTSSSTSPNVHSVLCGNGSYRNSTVSLADAQSQCPLPNTAICYDQSTRISYISQAVADMLCPTDVIQTSTYEPDRKSAYDRLNADRVKCGFGSVKQNAKLDMATQNHSNYLKIHQLDQHEEDWRLEGYTGDYSGDRMIRVGYTPFWANEGLPGYLQWGSAFQQTPPLFWVHTSEPNAAKGLRTLYTLPYHLATLVSGYREIGIGAALRDLSAADGTAFKKWYTFDYATEQGQVNTEQTSNTVLTFPCEGMEDLPTLQSSEAPDPFPGTDRVANPYGMPVYIRSATNTTLTLTSGTMTLRGGAAVPTVWLTKANDPNTILKGNEVFLSPTVGLADNAFYDVRLVGTNTGMITSDNPTGAFTRDFSFKTGTYLGQ